MRLLSGRGASCLGGSAGCARRLATDFACQSTRAAESSADGLEVQGWPCARCPARLDNGCADRLRPCYGWRRPRSPREPGGARALADRTSAARVSAARHVERPVSDAARLDRAGLGSEPVALRAL